MQSTTALIRKIIILAAIVGLLGFVANILIDNPYTHKIVRAAINDRVNKLTNVTFDFRALKASVMPLQIEMYGVAVRTKDKAQRTLFSSSRVKAKVSLFQILMGEIHISLIELNDPTLKWPPHWQFTSIFKESTSKDNQLSIDQLTWPLNTPPSVGRVVVHNGSIAALIPGSFQIPEKPNNLLLNASSVDLDFKFEDWTNSFYQIKSSRINLSKNHISLLEEASCDIILEANNQGFVIPRFKIQSQRLNANLQSRIRFTLEKKGILDTTHPRIIGLNVSGSGTNNGDLSILGSLLDLADTHGHTKSSFTFRSDLNLKNLEDSSLLIDVDASVEDGKLYGFDLYDSRAQMSIDKDKIAFKHIEVRIDDKTYATGTGSIGLDDQMPLYFAAKVSDLRLYDLLHALTLDFDLFDFSMASNNLVIKGSGEPFTMNISSDIKSADIQVKNMHFSEPNFPHSPSCDIALSLAITSKFIDYNGSSATCTSNQIDQSGSGEIHTPSQIIVSGQSHFVDNKGMRLDIRSSEFSLDLTTYFSQVPLQGSADLSIKIEGPYEHIQTNIALNSTNAQFDNIELGNFQVNAAVQSDHLKIHNFTIKPDTGSLFDLRDSKLDFNDHLTFLAGLQLTNLDARLIGSMLTHTHLAEKINLGILKLHGQMEGHLLNPLTYKGKLDVELDNISFNEERILDQASAKVLSNGKNITLNDIELRLNALEVGGSGKYIFSSQDLNKPNSLKDEIILQLHTLDPRTPQKSSEKPATADTMLPRDHLASLPFIGDYLANLQLEGLLKFKGSLFGTVDHLQGDFNAELNQGHFLGSPLAPVSTKGFINGGHLDVILEHAGQSVQGRLDTDFDKPGIPYQWFLQLKQVDLRPLLTKHFYDDARNYAYVTAEWNMQGHFKNWWQSTGKLKIHDIHANFVKDANNIPKHINVQLEKPITFLFDKDEWAFEDNQNLLLIGDFIRFKLATPGFNPPESLNLQLDGTFNLGLLQEFIPQVEIATGDVKFTSLISGSIDNPNISLEIEDLKPNPFNRSTWNPLVIGISDMRPSFKNIKFKVFYKDNRLLIDSLVAEKGSGSLSASGVLVMDEQSIAESRLDISLRDTMFIFPIPVLKTFESQLSGNLSLAGKKPPYRLTGEINIDRGRATRDIDIRQELVNTLKRQNLQSLSTFNEQALLELNLNVLANNSVQINNRNLQAVLSSNLQIRGSEVNPSIIGQIEVEKGKFIYKRDFNIERGLITFDDPIKPDPSLDILATTDVSTYRIYTTVMGKVSNPAVELTVDPPNRPDGSPITKEEIIVLMSRGDLPESNRTIGDTQVAATYEAFNLFLGQVDEPVEKLFDLTGQNFIRNLYLDTYPSPDGKPIPRLNLPMDIGERFDVILRADQVQSSISTEYDIHDNITFSSKLERRVNETSESGPEQTISNPAENAQLDLKFRFSFD